MAVRGTMKEMSSLREFVIKGQFSCQTCRYFKAHPDVAAEVVALQAEGLRVSAKQLREYIQKRHGDIVSESSIYHHYRREHK